jgi:hypothetical protein
MNDARLRQIAAIGLVIGALLGMAGTFAPSASLRGLAWGVDGTALIVATALLTVHHLRRGNDLAAAGFLVFVVGETLILSGAGMDLEASAPSFRGRRGVVGGVARDGQRLERGAGPRQGRRTGRRPLVRRRRRGDLCGPRVDAVVRAVAVFRVSVPGGHALWMGVGAFPAMTFPILEADYDHLA